MLHCERLSVQVSCEQGLWMTSRLEIERYEVWVGISPGAEIDRGFDSRPFRLGHRWVSAQLRVALTPLLSALETITERIREYDDQIEKLAEEKYPEVALLKQVKGIGTLIALTYILTLEDPRRFHNSRDATCYVGLQPGRRNSGQSEPQLHITREEDSYLRMVLVQGAQHILGPFREDSDLRRWGLKLAERGGKNAKKRAIVAVVRKLAVLLHHPTLSANRSFLASSPSA